LQRKPEIGSVDLIFWQCFTDLDASRSSGMGVSPISPHDVEAWARIQQVTCGQLIQDIWSVVHLVDRHRLSSIDTNSEKT